MTELTPINQTKLFGLDKYINELIKLENLEKLPNKILLTGQKGLGKSTLAYHFINYVLSKNEEFEYDNLDYKIDSENYSFKTTKNLSNPNFLLLDTKDEKKIIDINQIRDLIINLNKSSFNQKPRFVLVDNIEFLNKSSINALLKILEEPSENIYFILINNSNKKIIPTLLSRCINFKIKLSNSESLMIANKLLNGDLNMKLNSDLINYYSTPGEIYKLVKFGEKNEFNLINFDLKELLTIIIKENLFKKSNLTKDLIFDYIEIYLSRIKWSNDSKILMRYKYFIKRISEIKRFNLDEESFLIEFNEEILNG